MSYQRLQGPQLDEHLRKWIGFGEEELVEGLARELEIALSTQVESPRLEATLINEAEYSFSLHFNAHLRRKSATEKFCIAIRKMPVDFVGSKLNNLDQILVAFHCHIRTLNTQYN